MKTLFIGLSLVAALQLSAQQNWSGNTSPSYDELIVHLKKLDQQHKEIKLYNMGASDYGQPIYLCVINGHRDSSQTFEKARQSTTILINNAIHPGEPDGINACLIWLDQWIRAGKPLKSHDGQDLPVIAFIPAYNVGGMYNRSSTSRANQNGPE
ncbi:MAG: M14 family zinc carboxypeptidase, partial [Flavobacteriia bacterium]